MVMINKLCLCKVCGYDLGDYSWGEDGLTPMHIICPCCGIESGYEDCSYGNIIGYRKQWIMCGYKWFLPKKKPKDWDLNKQLENLKLLDT